MWKLMNSKRVLQAAASSSALLHRCMRACEVLLAAVIAVCWLCVSLLTVKERRQTMTDAVLQGWQSLHSRCCCWIGGVVKFIALLAVAATSLTQRCCSESLSDKGC